MAIVDKETDERKMLSPLEEDSVSVSREPLDFHKLTPTQFGITVQSFSPAPSGSKEKSRLAQLKARRRSSVGVRGSPETNSLIRFIAQQKMKNSSNCRTPEQLVGGSPFLPRVASTLKQKIASFHSLMGVEESEVCELMPRQGDNTGGYMKTRDYLSDEYNQEEGKENHHRLVSPSPSKKRRVGPLKGCEVQIREADTPDVHFNGSDKEGDKEPVAGCNDSVQKGPLPSSDSEEETQLVLPSTPLHGFCEPPTSLEHYAFSSKNQQQDNVVEPQSPSRPRPRNLTSASTESFSAFQFPFLTSQMEIKSAEENESSEASAAKKKKRVCFGCPLSPEFFDQQLPPSTPLQKGGTPARPSTPGGILKLKSALKTPQRKETCTPQAQADLGHVFGGSPVLAMSYNHRMLHMAEDGVEKFEKIIFPSIEDSDSAVMTDTELINDAQLNLNDAFHDEAPSPVVTAEVKSEKSPAHQSSALNALESLSVEKQPETVSTAAPRLRNLEKKAVAESQSAPEFPAVRSRKRKQPEQSKPVRRSTRSAAKPSETIKVANRWKKEVNLSLYGSREYASKNPSLSPITEFFIHQPAAAQCSPTGSADESAYLKNEPSESSSSGPGTSVLPGESPSGAPLSSGKRTLVTNGCSSRPKATRRRLSKARVSIDNPLHVEPQMQTKEKTSEIHEEKITPITAVSLEVQTEQVSVGAEVLCTLTVADTPSTDTDTNSECLLGVDGSTSACLLEGEQSSAVTLTASSPGTTQQPQNVSSCPRRSVNLAEEQPQPEAETQQERKSDSPNETPGEETQVDSGLASWQANFNFEDVFKRVPSRRQRSVRRSLRNQSTTNDDTGLAWMPRISPEILKRTSRKTRRRRFDSTVLPTSPV
ncbi:cell division cycle-associated protein 2 [Hippocampus comes]|uniref:cell division cycle-associated protein 2 n=1 Tax=Hippocampus comes TaxID=109280 RepID=UPI00094F27F7|nr:PREDICTED: cell division cycle-associated protein 2 [Hippocampus comes]